VGAVAVAVVAEAGAVGAVVAVAVAAAGASAAGRLRAGLREPGGRPQDRLPVEVVRPGARAPAAVLPQTTGRRSVRPAGRRSPEEPPAAPQVLAGLESNPAADRLLPPAQAPPARVRVRVRRRDRPLRLVARKSVPARQPPRDRALSPGWGVAVAPRICRKRAKHAPRACRSAWPAATA
jgi:hypothetical protein